jgi:hypothetical protein
MQLKSIALIIICAMTTAMTTAQQKYKGTMVTKLGQTLQGEISVNLQGANGELIEIKIIEKNRSKGTKQILTTTAKYNAGVIKHIIIKDTIYFFRDIKTDYDDGFLQNVCVKLVYGTLDCGLFQIGDGTANNAVAVKFPKASLNELASVDFDYYNSSSSVAMRIMDCKTLVDKMIAKDEAVTWTEKASREQRIQCFKNIIDAYNKCEVKN